MRVWHEVLCAVYFRDGAVVVTPAQHVLHEARTALDHAGLTGSFQVRDLTTGAEIAIDPDRVLPVASLAKVPLAMAVLEQVRSGRLDGARLVAVPPGRSTGPGPTGTSRFRHPSQIALEDVVYLCVALSDNNAADALLDLVGLAGVAASLERAGISDIRVRHDFSALTKTPSEALPHEQRHLSHAIAIAGSTPGHGHSLAQMDVARGNVGTARAFVDLLAHLWAEDAGSRETPTVRGLMGANVHRHRLAPDFGSDSARWSSKTGTLLNLRHEIGVVEEDDGSVYAVAALTESRLAAVQQPAAEAVMSSVARLLYDHLRSETW